MADVDYGTDPGFSEQTLDQLIDRAISSEELGAVDFNMLRFLMQSIVDHLGFGGLLIPVPLSTLGSIKAKGKKGSGRKRAKSLGSKGSPQNSDESLNPRRSGSVNGGRRLSRRKSRSKSLIVMSDEQLPPAHPPKEGQAQGQEKEKEGQEGKEGQGQPPKDGSAEDEHSKKQRKFMSAGKSVDLAPDSGLTNFMTQMKKGKGKKDKAEQEEDDEPDRKATMII